MTRKKTEPKRRRGRPPGSKDTKPRRRREEPAAAPPPEAPAEQGDEHAEGEGDEPEEQPAAAEKAPEATPSLEDLAEAPPIPRKEPEAQPVEAEPVAPPAQLQATARPAWRDPVRVAGVAPIAQTMLCTGIAMACRARGFEPPDWNERGENGDTLGQALGKAGGAVVLKRFPWFESMQEELILFGLIGIAMEKARPIGHAEGVPSAAAA